MADSIPNENQVTIDFDSDEPLACPMRTGDDDEVCESCQ